jgi:hypothetical protein
MQCPLAPELPAKLEALGYDLANVGTAQRLEHTGPVTVAAFHLDMTNGLPQRQAVPGR